jgi:alkaline phosphatase
MISKFSVREWLGCCLLLSFCLSLCAEDRLRALQSTAIATKKAAWGHWGPDATKYSSWTNHSNRLIPVYAFGLKLDSVRGAQSIYRDEQRLKTLYGFLPKETVNPQAEYFDQTDIYYLQKQAVAAGKKVMVLMVFDGMDWQTTRAAAIYRSGRVSYDSGRGTGLRFQDYKNVETDFGYCVTSPVDEGTKVDVDTQKIKSPGNIAGGYAPKIAGDTPWSIATDSGYLIGKGKEVKHAYTDSAASATSLCAGKKTYNDAINVDAFGRELVPIARELQADGFGVGVVTSVPISHATPACAYANNVHRDDYQDLTRDMLGLKSIYHADEPLPGVDVLIGAGFGEKKDRDGLQGKNFVPGNRYLTADDLTACQVEHGGKYHVVQRTSGKTGNSVLSAGVATAIEKKQRLFGYFGGPKGHLPFRTADGKYDPSPTAPPMEVPAIVAGVVDTKGEKYSAADVEENPTLADMTEAALQVLHARGERFWLMVEAGDVDWANHSNNIDTSIGAVISGDEAFDRITQWIEKNVGWKDAALLVTADHGHYLVIDQPEMLIPNISSETKPKSEK